MRTWTGIGIHNCNPVFTRRCLEESLLRSIIPRTCQARQIEYHRHLALLRLCWQIKVQFHRRARRRCIVLKLQQAASEARNRRLDCKVVCHLVIQESTEWADWRWWAEREFQVRKEHEVADIISIYQRAPAAVINWFGSNL